MNGIILIILRGKLGQPELHDFAHAFSFGPSDERLLGNIGRCTAVHVFQLNHIEKLNDYLC